MWTSPPATTPACPPWGQYGGFRGAEELTAAGADELV